MSPPNERESYKVTHVSSTCSPRGCRSKTRCDHNDIMFFDSLKQMKDYLKSSFRRTGCTFTFKVEKYIVSGPVETFHVNAHNEEISAAAAF